MYSQHFSESLVKHYIQLDHHYCWEPIPTNDLTPEQIDYLYNRMSPEQRDDLVISYN